MLATGKRDYELLIDPRLNKSTAFTKAEKAAFGLMGLVSDVVESADLQLRRVLNQLGHKATDRHGFTESCGVCAIFLASTLCRVSRI